MILRLVVALVCCGYVSASFELSDIENGVYHKLDILAEPVSIKFSEEIMLSEDLEAVQLSSVYGQLYSCSYKSPAIVLANQSAEPQEAWLHINVTDLMEGYYNATKDCFKATKGWWTYEICPWRLVVQYHDDRDSRTSSGRSLLGLYAREFNWTNSTEHDIEVKKKYHSQHFENGSICDLTGKHREVDVQYLCHKNDDKEDGVVDIQEPETCRYAIQVHVHALCQSKVFRRSSKGHILVGITCNPTLTDDKMERYKEIAEKKKLKEEQKISGAKEPLIKVEVTEAKTTAALEKELLKAFEKAKDESVDGAANFDKTTGVEIEMEPIPQVITVGDAQEALFDLDEQAAFEAELAKVGDIRADQAAKLREALQSQYGAIIDEAEKELLQAENNPDGTTAQLDRDKALETLSETMEKIMEKVQQGDPRISADSLHAGQQEKENEDSSQQSNPDEGVVEIEFENGEPSKEEQESLSEAIKRELEKAGVRAGDRGIEIRVITAPNLASASKKAVAKDGSAIVPETSAKALSRMIAAVLNGPEGGALQAALDHQNLEGNYAINLEKELEQSIESESSEPSGTAAEEKQSEAAPPLE